MLRIWLKRHKSLPKPCTNGDVNEWFQWFDLYSQANGLANDTKELNLSTLLEREIFTIWLELSKGEECS